MRERGWKENGEFSQLSIKVLFVNYFLRHNASSRTRTGKTEIKHHLVQTEWIDGVTTCVSFASGLKPFRENFEISV